LKQAQKLKMESKWPLKNLSKRYKNNFYQKILICVNFLSRFMLPRLFKHLVYGKSMRPRKEGCPSPTEQKADNLDHVWVTAVWNEERVLIV
jgi:hypothetical protein